MIARAGAPHALHVDRPGARGAPGAQGADVPEKQRVGVKLDEHFGTRTTFELGQRVYAPRGRVDGTRAGYLERDVLRAEPLQRADRGRRRAPAGSRRGSAHRRCGMGAAVHADALDEQQRLLLERSRLDDQRKLDAGRTRSPSTCHSAGPGQGSLDRHRRNLLGESGPQIHARLVAQVRSRE